MQPTKVRFDNLPQFMPKSGEYTLSALGVG